MWHVFRRALNIQLVYFLERAIEITLRRNRLYIGIFDEMFKDHQELASNEALGCNIQCPSCRKYCEKALGHRLKNPEDKHSCS